MKPLISIRLWCGLIVLCTAVFAEAGGPPISAVLGKWVGTENFPNGARLETIISLNPDASFSGSASVDKKPFWEYSGTWEFKDGKIIWTYVNSSRPLPDAAKVDVDEVLSASDKELVLKSQSSGKQHTYVRSQ